MCFGGDGGAGKIAKQQRADEVARQARIAEGMKAIAAAFDGTKRGVGAATAYDPTKTYYRADGSVFDGARGLSIGGPWGGVFSLPEDPNDLVRTGQLFTDAQQQGGFGEDYYQKRAQDYIDYATPDLERQTKRTRDDLIYALARAGNLDSSAAIQKDNELTQAADAARISIGNKGLDYANQQRSNVENVRSGLVAELNATGDSTAAAQSALRQAFNLNTPQGFSPLADVFGSFASTIAQIGSNAGNRYSGFFPSARPLFSPGRSSMRVVGG